MGGGGVKNNQILRDVIYGCPLSKTFWTIQKKIFWNIFFALSSRIFIESECPFLTPALCLNHHLHFALLNCSRHTHTHTLAHTTEKRRDESNGPFLHLSKVRQKRRGDRGRGSEREAFCYIFQSHTHTHVHTQTQTHTDTHL